MVREATRADLLEVFRIERASFPQPWPYGAFEGFLGRPGFLVAERREGDDGVDVGERGTAGTGGGDGSTGQGGPIAGYVVADTVPNHGQPLGHIKDIAVHPDHRGEGIGRYLLKRALGVLRERDTSRVKLEVRDGNEPAITLYHDFGFTHHHTVPRYYEDGTDALVMVKQFD